MEYQRSPISIINARIADKLALRRLVLFMRNTGLEFNEVAGNRSNWFSRQYDTPVNVALEHNSHN